MKIEPENIPDPPERKPDAEMLMAFDEWCRVSMLAERLPDSATDAERQACSASISEAERVLAMPAETAAGVVVKLLHSFAAIVELPEAYEAVWSGTPADPDSDALSDARHAMMWSAIQDLQRISERQK